MSAGLRWFPCALIWSSEDNLWRDIAGNIVTITWKA